MSTEKTTPLVPVATDEEVRDIFEHPEKFKWDNCEPISDAERRELFEHPEKFKFEFFWP